VIIFIYLFIITQLINVFLLVFRN